MKPDPATPKTSRMYLRFVLLKACNLRCFFCHEEGDCATPNFNLQPALIADTVRAAMSLGIRTFKFTGGEPLMYPNLDLLIARIKDICPDAEISLTTNGLLLEKKLPSLLAHGLDRANVSLQSLDRQKYADIVGVDGLPAAMRGIELLATYNTGSKICSAFFKRNQDEILDMARYAKRLGLGYRVHNLLAALKIAEPEVIPIEEIEAIISGFPDVKKLDVQRNGKHRLIFTGPDWEIMMPDWRHWKKCTMSGCPLNDGKKKLCKEGEVYALRVTPDHVQTCLMGNHKGFPFSNGTEIATALAAAQKLVED